MKKIISFCLALFATTALWAAFTPAAFTVSADGKQVYFSQGNLQCSSVTTGEYVWSFAENQYDMLGADNVSGSALADKIDLFGWSANNETAKWGISTLTNTAKYAGDFVDWGQNIDDGNTYRTLTKDEWDYLLNTRTNASEKQGVARINLNEDGTQYANGLILLPDSWVCPEDITFKSGFATASELYDYYQTFTIDQWQKLEAAGAVFLPASGDRGYYTMYGVQSRGSYWCSTAYDSDHAHSLGFNKNVASMSYTLLYRGLSVRLVQNVKYAITITTPEHGNIAANKEQAAAGETVTLTVTPATGYELEQLEVKTVSGGTVTLSEDHKFTMPASNVTVSATFKAKTATALSTAQTLDLRTESGRVICTQEFQIFTLTGQNVTEMNGQLNGVYIVKVGEKVQKVFVSSK